MALCDTQLYHWLHLAAVNPGDCSGSLHHLHHLHQLHLHEERELVREQLCTADNRN